MDISSGERWTAEEKVSILLESELYVEIHVPSRNPRTLMKKNQSCIARQCTVTRRFHRVYLSRRKRKRIEVKSESWFDSRKSLSRNRHAVFFSVVNSVDNQDGLGKTLCDLSKARIAPYKNTWKRFQDTVFWCEARSTKKTAIVSNKIKRSYSLRHIACRVH